MTHVQSSAIDSLDYDEQTQSLRATFRNGGAA